MKSIWAFYIWTSSGGMALLPTRYAYALFVFYVSPLFTVVRILTRAMNNLTMFVISNVWCFITLSMNEGIQSLYRNVLIFMINK